MPEKAGRVRNGQLLLPIGQHRSPHGSHDPQEDHGPEHGVQQFHDPVRMLQGKHIVNKDLSHDRDGQTGNDHAKAQDHQEDQRPLVLFQFGRHRFHDAVGMPFGFEVFTRRNRHVYAGIGTRKFVPGYGALSHGRVVQEHRVPLETFQYQEMIELPEQDQGEFLFPQLFAATGEGLGQTALSPGGLQQVFRVAAVPGHAAFLPQKFQRQPAPVVSQHHSQRCGAAFRGFHL